MRIYGRGCECVKGQNKKGSMQEWERYEMCMSISEKIKAGQFKKVRDGKSW